MMIERVTFSNLEIPIEYIVFHYRGDSYELSVELHRDPARNILKPVDNLARLTRQLDADEVTTPVPVGET